MDAEIFKNNLIYLRKENNYTQKDLADKLNYSDKVISKWERGESAPDLEALNIISRFYGITMDELVRADLSSKEKTGSKSNKIEHRVLNGPSKLLKSSIWIVLSIYAIFIVYDIVKGDFILFLFANIGFLVYFVIYSWLLQNVVFIANHRGHEIIVKTNIWKVEMYIDDIVVDEVYNALKPNVRLTGKVEDERVKANISIFLNVKLSLFFE
jgi:transcriptional regulator with XRE-family HTH domain